MKILELELKLKISENGLLIKPIKNTSRDTWKENIENVIANNNGLKDEGLLEDLLNDNDLEEFEW